MPAVMPVVGRRSWLPADITNVRITNGLIRAGIVASAPNVNSRIRIEWWDTTWDYAGAPTEPYLDCYVGVVGGSTTTPFNMNTCQVLRNSVEEVTVRYTGTVDGITNGLCTIDLSVRRGSRMVFVDIASQNTTGTWQGWTDLPSTGYALDAGLTGYVVSDSPYQARWDVFATGANALSGTPAQGRVAQTSPTTSGSFAFGAGEPFTVVADSRVRQFYRSVAESARVVEF